MIIKHSNKLRITLEKDKEWIDKCELEKKVELKLKMVNQDFSDKALGTIERDNQQEPTKSQFYW